MDGILVGCTEGVCVGFNVGLGVGNVRYFEGTSVGTFVVTDG